VNENANNEKKRYIIIYKKIFLIQAR
jgi:hypothetical protein